MWLYLAIQFYYIDESEFAEKEGGVGGNVDSNPDSGLRNNKESELSHILMFIRW